MSYVQMAEEFRERLKEICANSRDGLARVEGYSGFVCTPVEYWFEGGIGTHHAWDLLNKQGHRDCVVLLWEPNDPITPLERLAKAAE